jgi:predicted anti-sigma-YlaC factor YlaD
MHLLVCAACRNFTDQMNLIRRAMRQLAPEKPDQDDKVP